MSGGWTFVSNITWISFGCLFGVNPIVLKYSVAIEPLSIAGTAYLIKDGRNLAFDVSKPSFHLATCNSFKPESAKL